MLLVRIIRLDRRPESDPAWIDDRQASRKLRDYHSFSQKLIDQVQNHGTSCRMRGGDDHDVEVIAGRVVQHVAEVFVARDES